MKAIADAMTLAAALRRRVRRGTALGSWLTLADPAAAEILARAGFDWLAVDLEHTPLTLERAQELIRVVSLCGVCPLVRLSANDPVLAKRVMDAGAGGVIVPMVNSRADAERAVASVRYPPAGTRGVGMWRAQGYGPGFASYLRASRAVFVAVQLEHKLAAENAAEILAVPGVDAFLVGPYDLSASLGVPGRFEHPAVRAALRRMLAAGRAAGVPAGYHEVSPDPAPSLRRLREGCRFLAYGTDYLFLGESARAGLARLRRGR